KIKKYLENGEKQIDKPEYMMLDFGNAGGVYKALSMYMHSYADAIGAGSIPSHPPPAYTQK
ncbi:hypothetical protein MMC12_008731, partial [Toensbergia leucococca]|nr:hypothetical protein [Toensbergia leucococca]